MANVKKLIGLFDMSSIAPKIVKETAQEISTPKTIENGNKLISTGLDAFGDYNKASINITNSLQSNIPETTDFTKMTDEIIPNSQKGIYGQDVLDPIDSLNKMDPLSPIIPDSQKGIYGQDILDPIDSLNKMDPLSPFYDPNNNF